MCVWVCLHVYVYLFKTIIIHLGNFIVNGKWNKYLCPNSKGSGNFLGKLKQTTVRCRYGGRRVYYYYFFLYMDFVGL